MPCAKQREKASLQMAVMRRQAVVSSGKKEQDRKVVSEDVEPAVRARTAVMDPQEPALAVAVGELLQAEVGQVHVNVLGEDGDQGRGCETAHCTKIWLKTGSARL